MGDPHFVQKLVMGHSFPSAWVFAMSRSGVGSTFPDRRPAWIPREATIRSSEGNFYHHSVCESRGLPVRVRIPGLGAGSGRFTARCGWCRKERDPASVWCDDAPFATHPGGEQKCWWPQPTRSQSRSRKLRLRFRCRKPTPHPPGHGPARD